MVQIFLKYKENSLCSYWNRLLFQGRQSFLIRSYLYEWKSSTKLCKNWKKYEQHGSLHSPLNAVLDRMTSYVSPSSSSKSLGVRRSHEITQIIEVTLKPPHTTWSLARNFSSRETLYMRSMSTNFNLKDTFSNLTTMSFNLSHYLRDILQ